MANGKPATASDVMAPNSCVSGALGAKAVWPVCDPAAQNGSCPREELVLEPGAVSTVRIINAATQVYMTVCFLGHNITVVAADARPVAPLALFECVDVNSGQQMDVQVQANAAPGPYWLSVTPQYRKGAPWAFGVLHTRGTTAGPCPPPPSSSRSRCLPGGGAWTPQWRRGLEQAPAAPAAMAAFPVFFVDRQTP